MAGVAPAPSRAAMEAPHTRRCPELACRSRAPEGLHCRSRSRPGPLGGDRPRNARESRPLEGSVLQGGTARHGWAAQHGWVHPFRGNSLSLQRECAWSMSPACVRFWKAPS
eukprot:scaffold107070_cov72-Phaeocystis_antarctica.AAC.6